MNLIASSAKYLLPIILAIVTAIPAMADRLIIRVTDLDATLINNEAITVIVFKQEGESIPPRVEPNTNIDTMTLQLGDSITSRETQNGILDFSLQPNQLRGDPNRKTVLLAFVRGANVTAIVPFVAIDGQSTHNLVVAVPTPTRPNVCEYNPPCECPRQNCCPPHHRAGRRWK